MIFKRNKYKLQKTSKLKMTLRIKFAIEEFLDLIPKEYKTI